MVQIEHILESFTSHHSDGNTDLIQQAYVYATEQHASQKRRSGEPYVVHPISVAKIVADMGLCEPSICAALLHDVIEDTDATREQVEELFGREISLLVDGVTKLDKVHFMHHEERQAESFRKMLVATVHDIRVLLIKLADRLHNMSTLDALPQNKQERIAQETRDIYSPLANRLGIQWLKAELDDLSFKYLEPRSFEFLQTAVSQTKKMRSFFIDRVKGEITGFLKDAGFNVMVTGRLKNMYSIHCKMVSKGLEYEQVHDAIAFRILCESVADCYAIFGLIHSHWKPVPGRIKDYIAMPKPNYYQSLHTTVVSEDGERMEVQIRTAEMHQVAEYGIAAHWAYKESRKQQEGDVYKWLKDILDNQDGVANSREFLDSVKVDLFHDEVFVFTPAGEVRSLPTGATPLDFAYAVHTEVGNHCSGAKVNGVQVSFTTRLANGDHVEIATSKNQRPSSAWLDIVVTSRAKNKIRAYLRAEERTQSIKVGRDLLEKALRRYGVSLNKILKTGRLAEIAPKHKLHTGDDVLAAIGHGKLDENTVAYRLIPEEQRDSIPSEVKESAFEKVLRKVKWQDDGIVIDGVDNLLIQFAKCCNPLPGEPVIGYISRGRGIIVHRKGCSKAEYLEEDRQTNVQWSHQAVSQRPVKLQIFTGDKPGILANLTTSFQAKGINITSAYCTTLDSERAVNTFTFMVKDLSQLNDLIKTLRQTKGVHEVNRVHG